MKSDCSACYTVTTKPGESWVRLCPLHAAAEEMRKLLGECADALYDEVNAAGTDDHPIIRAHGRLADKARTLLAKVKGE